MGRSAEINTTSAILVFPNYVVIPVWASTCSAKRRPVSVGPHTEAWLVVVMPNCVVVCFDVPWSKKSEVEHLGFIGACNIITNKNTVVDRMIVPRWWVKVLQISPMMLEIAMMYVNILSLTGILVDR